MNDFYTAVYAAYENDPQNLQLQKRTEKMLSDCTIDFNQIFIEAQKLTIEDSKRKQSHYQGRNYMAECMYGNVVGLLTDNYSSYMFKDLNNRPYVKLDADIFVYPKKLTPKTYLPSNIQTRHVNKLNYQELFENFGKINTLYAGFVLKEEDWFLTFEDVRISHLNKFFIKQAAWTIDLKDYCKYRSIHTPMSENVDNNNMLVAVKSEIVTIKDANTK